MIGNTTPEILFMLIIRLHNPENELEAEKRKTNSLFTYSSIGFIWSRDSSVGITMGYGLDGRGSILGISIFSLLHSVQIDRGAYRAAYPAGKSGRGLKLISHLHLVQRSRMVEQYFNFPIHLHGIVLK
jgi:hypothetical protein